MNHVCKNIYAKEMCRKCYIKDYYQKNKKRILKYRRDNGFASIKYMHKTRFGGKREEVMEMYDHMCAVCSMTRDEHREKWGRDLTIDHMDNQGRYSEEPNNDLNNLQVLCLTHHGAKDGKVRNAE